ncbi:MAG: SDR family NAD(P)-dependent oxidoreductase [Nitrospinota bacterium]
MLNDKVALVTGAGRGIGRAVALLMAKNSAFVYACSRSKDQIDETVRQVRDDGGEAAAISCDVADERQAADMFAAIKKDKGKLDILVNNAALFEASLVEETSLEQFRKVMSVNCDGAFLCAREAFKLMKSGGGSIVNVSSLAGVRGTEKFPGFCSYIVSKFGVFGLTEALAVEGRKYGIRANTVCPGAVDTEMLNKAAPDLYPRLSPIQVARTIVHLASPESSGVTGTAVEMFSHLLGDKNET